MALPAHPGLVRGEDEDFLKVLDELKGAGIAIPTLVFDIRHDGDFVGDLTAREFEVSLERFMGKYNVAQVGFRNAGMRTDQPREKIDAYWSSLVTLQKRLQREERALDRLGVLVFDQTAYIDYISAGIVSSRIGDTYIYEGKEYTKPERGYRLNTNYYALEEALVAAGK